MQDPFEPTPIPFHNRVEQKLSELQRKEKPAVRSYRWVVVGAVTLALLCGTALALEHLGVLHCPPARSSPGAPVGAAALLQPTQQQCDSELLDATVQDAYWDGETLSISLHVAPKGDYAFYTETDRGRDGENFDLIWWNGSILPFEEWKAGREALLLKLPKFLNGTKDITSSWDWVQNEQSETMLLQGHCDDLTQGATLAIEMECLLEDRGETELSTLTFTLPPMKKGEPEE